MSDRQHERPSPEASDAAQGREAASPAPRDGGNPLELRDALKGAPDGEAQDAIARASAVVGDDAGDAS